MRKSISIILVLLLVISTFTACGVKPAKEGENNDEAYIANFRYALAQRWKLSDSKKFDMSQMTDTEMQNAYKTLINIEVDIIGDISSYKFEDSELKKLAQLYEKGLELQLLGAEYACSGYAAAFDKNYSLGYDYRAVAMTEINNKYDLGFKGKNKDNLDDFIASYLASKETVDKNEFAEELETTLKYIEDIENSSRYSADYVTILKNTTKYEIASIVVEASFIDKDGLIIYQSSDYMNNIAPNASIKSTLYFDKDAGEIQKIELKVSVT